MQVRIGEGLTPSTRSSSPSYRSRFAKLQLLFLMAAALNPQLTAMLAALDVVQPGLGNEFVAHVGTTMALAAAMPPDW